MLVILWHITEHLGQSCQHPAVATCPETLTAIAGCLHLWPDIFGIAIIELFILVKHQVVAPFEVLIELIQIFHVARGLIEFCHHRHHHIECIGPPPEVILRLTHLIVHHLQCTGNLIIIGLHLIDVEICLETNLPVTKEHIVLPLAIVGILPLRLVLFPSALPQVVASPRVTIGQPAGIAQQFIGLHITRMVGSIIPERAHLRPMGGLPLVVDLRNDLYRRGWFGHHLLLAFGISSKADCQCDE